MFWKWVWQPKNSYSTTNLTQMASIFEFLKIHVSQPIWTRCVKFGQSYFKSQFNSFTICFHLISTYLSQCNHKSRPAPHCSIIIHNLTANYNRNLIRVRLTRFACTTCSLCKLFKKWWRMESGRNTRALYIWSNMLLFKIFAFE